MQAEHELGKWEQKVMYGVLRLGDKAYGLAILKEIKEEFGKEPSIGAVYTTLERLEQKGFIKSRLGGATPERGGRAKKFFTVTGTGQAAYDRAAREAAIMQAAWSPQGA